MVLPVSEFNLYKSYMNVFVFQETFTSYNTVDTYIVEDVGPKPKTIWHAKEDTWSDRQRKRQEKNGN